jgi:hypothetical protein
VVVRFLATFFTIGEPEAGVAVTVKRVIARPPLGAGAVQTTTDAAFAFEDAETMVGAPGAVATPALATPENPITETSVARATTSAERNQFEAEVCVMCFAFRHGMVRARTP